MTYSKDENKVWEICWFENKLCFKNPENGFVKGNLHSGMKIRFVK